MKLYPFKFQPILKPMIWGGTDIAPFKNITTDYDNIGESWEISGVEGNVSVIANGELANRALDEILSEAKENLVGKKVYQKYGNTFPLLIKFIDAKSDLSIQVHPDDKLGKERHNSFGKTEMWYVVNAAPDAFLYSGFEKELNPDEYKNTVNDNSFTDYLKRYEVKSGDVFFLPAGRVHAIGSGCFVAEIQQTSNITYRIYDYDRTDADGNKRELHTELAQEAIDFEVSKNYKTDYTPQTNNPVALASCEYFTTNLLDIDEPISRNLENRDSFTIYICMEGKCTLIDDEGNSLEVNKGESILVPATAKSATLTPHGSTKLLETFVE